MFLRLTSTYSQCRLEHVNDEATCLPPLEGDGHLGNVTQLYLDRSLAFSRNRDCKKYLGSMQIWCIKLKYASINWSLVAKWCLDDGMYFILGEFCHSKATEKAATALAVICFFVFLCIAFFFFSMAGQAFGVNSTVLHPPPPPPPPPPHSADLGKSLGVQREWRARNKINFSLRRMAGLRMGWQWKCSACSWCAKDGLTLSEVGREQTFITGSECGRSCQGGDLLWPAYSHHLQQIYWLAS